MADPRRAPDEIRVKHGDDQEASRPIPIRRSGIRGTSGGSGNGGHLGAGSDEGEDVERILRLLRDPTGPGIIPIGRIPSEALGHWPDRVTDEVVITRERRNHYLERHPDMLEFEGQIIRTLLDPTDVHANKNDRYMAIFYTLLDERLFVRVPVLISTSPDLRNSVMSARRSDRDQVEAGRRGGRLTWQKK